MDNMQSITVGTVTFTPYVPAVGDSGTAVWRQANGTLPRLYLATLEVSAKPNKSGSVNVARGIVKIPQVAVSDSVTSCCPDKYSVGNTLSARYEVNVPNNISAGDTNLVLLVDALIALLQDQRENILEGMAPMS